MKYNRSRVLETVILSPLACAMIFAMGCRAQIDAPLADVESVTPEIVEPGDVLRIGGIGFVEGPAQITLRGRFETDTQAAPEIRSLTLVGTAVSEQSVELAITSKLMAQIAAEPTRFWGKIEISFPTATHSSGIRIVAAEDGVKFDFRPTGTSIPQAVSRARDARRFLKSLGITLNPDDWGGGESLVVEDVARDSAGERAGLRLGDRLLAANGVALGSVADLADFTTASIRLDTVTRSGTIRQTILNAGLEAHLTGDELAAIVLASIALGLFLAFSAPMGRRFPSFNLFLGNPLLKALYFGVISLVLLIVPATIVLALPGYLGFLVLLGVNAFGIAAYFWSQPGNIFGRLVSWVVHFAPTPIMLLLASALGSTTSAIEIVAGQESAPWGINAWSGPFSVVALILTVSLSWSRGHSGKEDVPNQSIAGWIAAVPAACLLVIGWLGGWWVPGIPTEQMTRSAGAISLGCLVFLAKTWLILLTMRWFASHTALERRARRRQAVKQSFCFLALVAVAGASLWWFLASLPQDIRIAGQLLATGASVSLCTAAIVTGLKMSGSSPDLGHNFFGDNRRDKAGDIPA